MRKQICALMAAVVASGGIAYAASHGGPDPVAMRQGAMQANAAVFGNLAGIAKGNIPFDAKVVGGNLEALYFLSHAFGDYFPEGSGEGDTTTSGAVWSDAAGWTAALTKWQGDIAAVQAAMPTDAASVGAAVGAIGANCKSCHEGFRKK
jgi:cytochrome c556